MEINTNIIANMLAIEASKPEIYYETQAVSVTTSTALRSPQINFLVGPQYLAISAETATSVTSDEYMPDWTVANSLAVSLHRTSVRYKVLESMDSGSRFAGKVGGTQYDQILFFRKTNNQTIKNVRLAGTNATTSSGAISTTLTTASNDYTYIAIHYYFSGTANPTITYDMPMQRVANSSSTLTGFNYAIYNGITPPQLTQTVTSTLGTNPRQILFWLALS